MPFVRFVFAVMPDSFLPEDFTLTASDGTGTKTGH